MSMGLMLLVGSLLLKVSASTGPYWCFSRYLQTNNNYYTTEQQHKCMTMIGLKTVVEGLAINEKIEHSTAIKGGAKKEKNFHKNLTFRLIDFIEILRNVSD